MRNSFPSTFLNGSAEGKLDFGNCWNRGVVKVYLNGDEIGDADPNTPRYIL